MNKRLLLVFVSAKIDRGLFLCLKIYWLGVLFCEKYTKYMDKVMQNIEKSEWK